MQFLAIPFALYVMVHICFNIPSISKNYFGELYNLKKSLLSKHKEDKKIVIIGGSNGKFSYNSKQIQDSTGYKVVNAAIQGNCGLAFYIDFVRPYLKKEDILILSPEYDLLLKENGLYGNYQYIQLAGYENGFYKKLFSNLNSMAAFCKQSFFHFKALLEVVFVRIKFPKGAIDYVIKKQHNAYGDIDSLDNSITFNFKNYSIIIDTFFYTPTIPVLNDFARYCKNNNIQFCINFPSAASQNIIRKVSDKELLDYISKTFPEIILLNTPSSSIYDKSWFYDSPYHLRGNSRIIHTTTLIDNLKNKAAIKN